MKTKISLLIIAALCAPKLSAWEVDTHAWMSREAFDRSILNPNTPEGALFAKRFGFDRLDTQAVFRSPGLAATGTGVSSKYFDLEGDWDQNASNPVIPAVANRFPNDWEHSRFPGNYRLNTNPGSLGPTPQLRLESWLMRGVVREDDVSLGEFLNPPIPDADPYGDTTRVFGHFYDPINNDGIPDVPLVINEQRVKAINWSLGLDDALAPTFNPLLTRRNHFGWLDARRAYFKALTYQTAAATQSSTADEFESETRLFFLATMTKSLGQVVHILQDGSQPQHSRLDRHNHSNMFWPALFNTDLPRRLMEVYTNIRVTRDINLSPQEDREPLRAMFTGLEGNVDIPPPPAFGTYPIPTFSTPRRFMTTRTQSGGDAIATRKGLMDYSNRGFFTEGTASGRPNIKLRTMPSPPTDLAGSTEVSLQIDGTEFVDLTWSTVDQVAPSYVDALDAPYQGVVPQGGVAVRNVANFSNTVKVNLEARHLRNHANVLIPRAISYSTGLINYFFRGTLEIEPIDQRVFAVVNQGDPHIVDANGWPRKTAGGSVFGFEKIRLKVRNITTPITEPGVGGAVVPQTVGTDGQLIAIARYHRNLCYQRDMSGERTQAYAPPPLIAGAITEPNCAAGTTRSVFQDISVSVPIAISNVAQLPGGSGTPLPASVETTFDFAIDPIPVNATDLIIQVVYRGTLGEEPESIALGTLDVREPTYYAAWNNTDFYFSEIGNQWLVQNPLSFMSRGMDGITICAGAATASRLIYRYIPENGPAISFYNGTTGPGIVRLAMIFPEPATATQNFVVRSNPLMLPPPSAQSRFATTKGQRKQASQEFFTAANPLPSPRDCLTNPPVAGEAVWCNDPIQRRRSQPMGAAIQPVYYTTGSNGANGPDVDGSNPTPHTVVPGLRLTEGGVNRFNVDETLVSCPAANTAINSSQRLIELMEEAAELGIEQ
jgi:hypothetical protein